MSQECYMRIGLDRRVEYDALWACSPSRSIDYSLVNLWGWANHFGLSWRFSDGLCWIRQMHPVPCQWAPIGPWASIDWAKLPEFTEGIELERVPEALVTVLEQCLPGRVSIVADRNHWEYLYATGDMADLPGNRYHRKRNHVNAYTKTYGEPDYRPLDTDVIEDILTLSEEWCRWHECADSPALAAENEAINHVISHWGVFPHLLGGALYAEGKIVAFAVGEELDPGMVGVHFEKGRHGYRGVYQMVSCCFARGQKPEITLLNRAQDLGEEGLRQAKLSYLPVDFLRKYTVRVLPG
ncbi:MAG: phosphatidylglycerol lysyltransferase domain-containing protein [Betaproteobacteria bacterium]|nr:phosphatidylglycerol lysyltransferase domain-containing protein [Betaproteobacteria bacterium]